MQLRLVVLSSISFSGMTQAMPVLPPFPPNIIRAPADSFPKAALKRGLVGAPRVQLTISTSGRLIHCTVVRSSGVDEFDADACKMMQTAKYSVAEDVNGKPIIGVRNQNINYMQDGRTTMLTPPVDLQVVVKQLPIGSGTFQERDAALTVDSSGKVESCQVLGVGGQPDGLSRALCKMAVSELSFKPALDENDKPVRSVQGFAIEFSQADAPLVRIEKR